MKRNVFYSLWIAAILALVALHAVHIRADFPNHSPWMDFSKFTDEGWYGKAAIDYYATGSWYRPGDFNAAIVLPVLPALEFALFHFTGPGLAAARFLVLAFFTANLALVYILVRMCSPHWAALIAVTLLAANAFLYAFSRLAILEQLFTFFLLVSWLIALRLPPQASTARAAIARGVALAACGLTMCLMVLSKTTAIVLVPSTLFLLWTSAGPGLASRAKAVTTAAIATAIPWSLYYFLWVRPHYLADYQSFFDANQYGNPATLNQWATISWQTLNGVLWISPALVILCLALLAVSLFFFRSLWRNRLLVASLLSVALYLAFIAWHNNVQPRYYQAVAYPLAIVLSLALEPLARAARHAGSGSRLLLIAAKGALAATAIVLALSTAANLRQMTTWVRHPEYTWLNAANALTRYVDHHPNGNRLLLSDSGDEITLTTGLPAICDEFGSWDLPARTQRYQPGWYAAWNDLDPDIQADLESQYTMEQVATFNAFDDPYRDQLILYKLHPLRTKK
jgi:4-amino-4-deoxy-L-arabinose transferase-like glycosyltransferase